MRMIRRGYADTPDGQLHYRHVDGPGVPIVLLHRTPASSASFERMLALMAGRRRAIAFDTPGFGQSFTPAGSPDAGDYARWFLAALDALGITEVHLCAHHTGTHFAAELAVAAPARVRSLLLSGVLYADAGARATMRADIGTAQPIAADGSHFAEMWRLMKMMTPPYDPALVQSEAIGAVQSITGRDQAFDAIYRQDFAAVLARVTCPIRISQAADDPLGAMLARVAAAHPAITIETIGAAGLTATERQPAPYTSHALAFAGANDSDPNTALGHSMTDRRFQLVKTDTGYDIEQVAAATPEAGPGEVVIRVRAVSLNKRDNMIRQLTYPVGDANHFVPLSDAAGEIVAVGEGVTEFAPRDRVISTFFQGWQTGRLTYAGVMSALGAGGRGVLADHIVLSAQGITKMPHGWSFEQGAAIPCAGVTAWNALMTRGNVQSGDWVLVIGTGGVALFALQIAVAAGANVVVISSSDDKLAKAKAMGAAATVNYVTTPDWDAAVREASGGGVNHVVELGGVGTLDKSFASLAIDGHVALIGALAGFGGDISGMTLIFGTHRIGAVTCGSRADQIALTHFMVEHQIEPVIDHVFGPDQIEDAYARADVGAFGKVVVALTT